MFKRTGDHIRWTLGTVEAELLGTLLDQLLGVLDRPDPADPAVARLFPATVLGDDEADAELRRLIHDDLTSVKQAGLEALRELLDGASQVRGDGLRIVLSPDDAHLVLGVLNDLRLAIGARVGHEVLVHRDVDPESPVAYRLAVMDHLGMWQELLLAIIDPSSVRVHEELDLDDL